MGSYEKAVYYDYQTLWEQKKIPQGVYETALSLDREKDGLNIFEFENFLQRYKTPEEREEYFIPNIEVTSEDELKYMYDLALPDNIEASSLVSDSEKSRLKRRNLIAGGSAFVGLAGTATMCFSKLKGFSPVASTRIGVVGFGIALIGTVVSLVSGISAAVQTKRLEERIAKSEGS